MQSQPIMIPTNGIGFKLMPNNLAFNDPVIVRYILCMMIISRNLFHICLCWRQLWVCNFESRSPPSVMAGSMTKEKYIKSKAAEMLYVEQKLYSFLADTLFSCIELFCGIFPFMWRVVVRCYSTMEDDDTWRNIAFMALLATYMVLRGLPVMFYTKFVLEPFYGVQPQDSLPVVGILCTYALFVVLIQVILIPLTTVFLIIEKFGGRFFVLWIWGFLFLVTCMIFVMCNIFGVPLLGKLTQLTPEQLGDELENALCLFNFPLHRVYHVNTYNIIKPTVFALGFWRFKRLLIVTNLYYNMNREVKDLHPDDVGKGLKQGQIVAYVVHELSHWQCVHHIKIFFIMQAALLVYLILYGICYRIEVLYEAAGFPAEFYPPIVGYWLVYKYVMPAYLTITNWTIYYMLRKFEYTADKNVWQLGYGISWQSALLQLSCDNSAFPYVDDLYMMWHRRKPTYLQRIMKMDPVLSRRWTRVVR